MYFLTFQKKKLWKNKPTTYKSGYLIGEGVKRKACELLVFLKNSLATANKIQGLLPFREIYGNISG